MAVLEIKKVQVYLEDKKQHFNIEVEELIVKDGEVHVIPKSKKYSWYNIRLKHCKILA